MNTDIAMLIQKVDAVLHPVSGVELSEVSKVLGNIGVVQQLRDILEEHELFLYQHRILSALPSLKSEFIFQIKAVDIRKVGGIFRRKKQVCDLVMVPSYPHHCNDVHNRVTLKDYRERIALEKLQQHVHTHTWELGLAEERVIDCRTNLYMYESLLSSFIKETGILVNHLPKSSPQKPIAAAIRDLYCAGLYTKDKGEQLLQCYAKKDIIEWVNSLITHGIIDTYLTDSKDGKK